MKAQILWLLSVAILCAGPLEDSLATGRKAFENDGIATAWKIAQKAIQDSPDSAAAHEFAGEVSFRRGDFAQADTEFKNAIELNRQMASAWWGLARVAECAAMNRTAIEDYKHAYELDPKDPKIAAIQGAFAKVRERQESMVLTSPYQTAEIPLLRLVTGAMQQRRYGLEVLVNGNPLKLVLDTGAAGIVISRGVAAQAGLVRLSDATMQGIGDTTKVANGYRAQADHFKVGGVEYRNAPIQVAGQDLPDSADGLIGSNVFSEFLITLDFAAARMRLEPIPGYKRGEIEDRTDIPQMRDGVRVFRFGHLLLVPVHVNSHTGLFVLDTGAARTMMSYDLAAESSKVNPDDQLAIRGLSGKVGNVYQTGDVVLEFGGFVQKNPAMTAIDTWQVSHRLGTEISGFLGLPVLDLFTLTLDYRDGVVKFERRP
jgi:predicted aspartyl protease